MLFRRADSGLEIFLVHPGGPFFARKDEGAWTIPKGEPDPGEELLATAVRELTEETGLPAPVALVGLGEIKQKGGKVVHAWAGEAIVPDGWILRCNSFEMQWPPRSGRMQSFPEIDRGEWFDPPAARRKLNPAQVAFVDRLEALDLGESGSP